MNSGVPRLFCLGDGGGWSRMEGGGGGWKGMEGGGGGWKEMFVHKLFDLPTIQILLINLLLLTKVGERCHAIPCLFGTPLFTDGYPERAKKDL